MITLDHTPDLPDQPGIYIFKEGDTPIYIGKSVSIRARVRSHIHQSKLSKKEFAIVSTADSLDVTTTLSGFDALLLEAKLIQKYQPKYNVVWKDDKNYLYIKIDVQNDFPYLTPVRKEDDGASKYYGPFKSTYMTQKLLYELRKIVPFATHPAKAGRACFYAKLGMCDPCPNVIAATTDKSLKKELKDRYRKNIRKAVSILSGKTQEFAKQLGQQLKAFTEDQKYEEAIVVRNKMFQFSMFLDRRSFDEYKHPTNMDMDVLRQEVANFLDEHFNQTIGDTYRVECYDISNLYGKEATGSMVVFANGMFARKEYRKFRIARKGISDIHMLEEVLQRRLEHDEWTYPDLMILDGGTPQLRKLYGYFREKSINIPLISIAKRPDRILVPYNGYKPIHVDKNSMLFKMIQALRDESHRFAKKYHVALRNRNFLE